MDAEEPVITEASSQGRDGQEKETGQSGLGNGSLEEGRGLELETYVTPDVEVEKRGQARGPDPGHRDGEPEERRREKSQEPSEELIKDEQTTDGNAQLNIILKFMEGMQQIQKKIMNGGNNHTGEEENAEVVKSAVELPMLPELSADTGPIDLQDWLTMVGPVMADLSDTSQEWWELMLKHTKKWYDKYMTEPPLQRLLLTPTPPSEVCNGRWRRVERRAVTLLMKALPDQVKEELIATKSLDVFSLICRLMLLYQPGGVAERSAILKNLEQPQEATSIQAAVQGIRRWLRWRRRAEEIGVSLPDPSVLNRGLQRLTKKVLENNKDLNFKISLARSTLQVDTVPNYSTIGTYCEHLLSELEQLVHTEKKVAKATDADSKVKKFEGAGAGYGYGGGKGGESRAPRKEGEARERKPCRYYLTDVGCRRGRQCTFAHDAKDDKNRCYECGATDHYRKDCTRKQQEKTPGNKMDKSPGKIAKVSEVEDEENNRQEGDQEETSSASTATLKGSAKNAKDGNEGDGLQSVLEEAGKMLRSLNIKASAATDRREREDRMNDLQKQLDQMRKMRALRFAKVSKIDYQHEYGLLDSGATHSMRGACPGDDVENLEKIQVELAGGEKKELLMTAGKVIIHEDRDVQPIVPLGLLIEKMGCEVTWTKKGACRLRHPTMGEIPVQTNAGCPEVEKGVALALIDALEELEEGRDAKLSRIKEEDRVVELIRSERAFNGVPGEVMEKVVVAPAKDLSGLPLNRSRRRKLQEGFVVHLYAGEEEGYTLSRALKEVGGDKTRLVEIDLKRGADHDMMKDEVYAALMGAAFNGLVLGVVGGPNCRTRSVLRHYPLPAGKPRPVRGVAPEHWFGLPGLDEEEKRQVWEDDVLMYRMIMLYCAAEEGRKNRGLRGAAKTEVAFLLEQPDVPQYMPDCGSWWRTGNFRDLRDQHGLVEYSFRQGDYGGVAVKPTRVVTNLQLSMPATRSTTATTREESAVRRLLKGAELAVKFWPMAARYAVVAEEKRLKGEQMVASFGEEVWVPKRSWKKLQDPFGPTHEKARYLAEIPEVTKGHGVLRQDGKIEVVSKVVTGVREPKDEEPEEEGEAHVVRRRIREKTKPEDLGEEYSRLEALKELIMEEKKATARDEGEILGITAVKLRELQIEEAKVQEEMYGKEEKQVLQTRIAGPAEVMRDKEEWIPAIEAEMKSLLEEKKAVRIVTGKEAREMMEDPRYKVDLMPGKMVTTIKAPNGKKKCRTATKCAAENNWDGKSKQKKVVLMRPPAVLVRLGLCKSDEYWAVERALYGLREKDEERRGTSSTARTGGPTMSGGSSTAGSMEWTQEGHLQGLAVVYVDDILAYGGEQTLEEFVHQVKAMWETSTPEKIQESSKVRFCGMEISRTSRGYFLGQQAYTQEVLNRNGGGGLGSVLPITREMAETPEELDITAAEVQAAQRAVGEILWLTTKTRPDLMYVTSRMSSAVTKAPKWVMELADQVWRYLKKTKEVGLWLERQVGNGESGLEGRRIEVYTDASFSPGGGLSHGSVAVLWNGGAIAWRSSRQSFPTMSTAESELAECLEGIVMGESVEALVAEIEEAAGNAYVRQLLTDSSSAIAIASEGSGSWRTRHLRVRAYNLRWRLDDQSWTIHHVPGVRMLADLGTKALSGKRMEELRKLWKLEQYDDQKEDVNQEEQMGMDLREEAKLAGQNIPVDAEMVTGAIKVLTIASLISQVQAVKEKLPEGEMEDDESLKALMTMVSVLSIVLYKLVEMMCTEARSNIEGSVYGKVKWGGGFNVRYDNGKHNYGKRELYGTKGGAYSEGIDFGAPVPQMLHSGVALPDHVPLLLRGAGDMVNYEYGLSLAQAFCEGELPIEQSR
ncbi:unnamed protein product [Effrenium voratum]|nr:unnamed protein product [Effrenium voratum]